MYEENGKEKEEFCGKQIIMELKLTCVLNIDNFHDLKEEVLKMIKNRVLNINPEYIMKKIITDGQTTFGSTSGHGYIRGKYSEYTKITPDQKRFLRSEIADVRKNLYSGVFTRVQEKKMDEIYVPLQEEIERTFNNSPVFTEPLNDSHLQWKLEGN